MHSAPCTVLNICRYCVCSEQRHWGKRGLSPPREEDRKLPLHKLFENLQEFEQTVPASVCYCLSVTTVLVKAAAYMPAFCSWCLLSA